MEPAYRDGAVILVSPAASIRRGDRVVVKTKEGEVMVKELKRRTAKTVELRSVNPAQRPQPAGARRRVDRAGDVGEPIAACYWSAPNWHRHEATPFTVQFN